MRNRNLNFFCWWWTIAGHKCWSNSFIILGLWGSPGRYRIPQFYQCMFTNICDIYIKPIYMYKTVKHGFICKFQCRVGLKQLCYNSFEIACPLFLQLFPTIIIAKLTLICKHRIVEDTHTQWHKGGIEEWKDPLCCSRKRLDEENLSCTSSPMR